MQEKIFKYDYNVNCFTDEDEISYYLLGVFLTDGCIYKNNKKNYACQISSTDKEWLEDMMGYIGSNLKLHKFSDNYNGIRIFNQDICNWLIKNECIPNKTLNVKFPIIPKQYTKDLIRGIIDGDGSIGTYGYKRVCSIISASKDFLDSIAEFLALEGIKHKISEKFQKTIPTVNSKQIIQKNRCYVLTIQGKNANKLLNMCYYPDHKLSLARKNLKAQEIITYYSAKNLKL